MPGVRGMCRLCGIYISQFLSARLESLGTVRRAGGYRNLSLLRILQSMLESIRIDTVRAENQCRTIAGP